MSHITCLLCGHKVLPRREWVQIKQEFLLAEKDAENCTQNLLRKVVVEGNSFNNSIFSFFFSPFYFHKKNFKNEYMLPKAYLEPCYAFEQSSSPSVDAEKHNL